MVDKRKAAALFVLFMILAAAAIIAVIRRVRVKTYSFDTVDAVFRNPMMGFAPNADYFDAVGDNTLVYMDVTWRELEPEEGVFLRGGDILCRHNGQERRIMTTADIRLPGVHNVENYMAAIAAVEGLVPDGIIRDFARTFTGVEHRIELVRSYHGVRY